MRNAYFVARDIKKEKGFLAAASCSTVQKKDWTFIWKLKIPNKIRVFLWRSLTNGLPMFQNLVRRKIDVNPLCPVCFESTESVLHIFQTCQFARLVWAISGLPAYSLVSPNADLWDWIQCIKQVLAAPQFEYFICLCWCLWNHRNRVVHENKHEDAMDLVAFAGDYLSRYKAAQYHFATPRPPNSATD